MEKFLSHPLVKNGLPLYLEDIIILKCAQELVGNLKATLTTHLIGACLAKLVMAKDVIYLFATSPQSTKSGKSITRMLDLDRWNIKKRLERHMLLDTYSDATSLNILRSLMNRWWENETTISPNMKDVVRRHTIVKLYETHRTHYLQMSQVTSTIFSFFWYEIESH
jgi:hypothetical protein